MDAIISESDSPPDQQQARHWRPSAGTVVDINYDISTDHLVKSRRQIPEFGWRISGLGLRTSAERANVVDCQQHRRDDLDLKAVSERYFAAWADRDPDAIIALHTPDTPYWTHLGGEPVVGRDAVRATFAELFGQFPGLSFEIYRVLYGHDRWVLDWALISGDIRFDCLDVVDVSPDGLVARKDTFVDAVQLQAAVGTVST